MRIAEKHLSGIQAVRRRCSTRRGLPVPEPCTFACEQCADEPAFVRSRPVGRRVLEGGGLMLRLDTSCKAFKSGSFGGGEVTAVSA